MSSVTSHILNHKLTGGNLIAVSTAANTYVASVVDAARPTAASTGSLNAAGSVYNFNTQANASTAIGVTFAAPTALVVGQLYEDMGDRILFSAAGQTIAIFAKVRLMNQVAYEGTETPLYLCIWAGAPSGAATVGVARL